jgi:hypothetical protein
MIQVINEIEIKTDGLKGRTLELGMNMIIPVLNLARKGDRHNYG